MLQDSIRIIIRNQQATPQHIGKLANIDKSTMSRFMAGKSLGGKSLDRLATLLQLKISTRLHIKPARIGRPKIGE